MSSPPAQATPTAEDRAQNLDADLVIANLSDRIGRDARSIAMLQAALSAQEAECVELRAELVKATGGRTKSSGSGA